MIIIECVHCKCLIEIIEINCRIFRHGVFKRDFNQIPPHLNKEECEKLIKNDEIYGCGKPFKLNSENQPEICDYI